jgi:hypothetical protein
MNPKSLLITILVAFITVFATDFLIHGVLLAGTYKATASLWRPEAEMMAKMPWMMLGQFLAAAAFTMIFAACVAEKRCMSCTIKFAGIEKHRWHLHLALQLLQQRGGPVHRK